MLPGRFAVGPMWASAPTPVAAGHAVGAALMAAPQTVEKPR